MVTIMKHSPLYLATVAMTALLSNCASPVTQRIAARPEAYQKLNDKEKTLVQHGEIRRGMSKDAVLLAWGQPDRQATTMIDGRPVEKWTYSGYAPTYGAHATYDTGNGFRREDFTGPLTVGDSESGNFRLTNVRSGYFYNNELAAWSTLW